MLVTLSIESSDPESLADAARTVAQLGVLFGSDKDGNAAVLLDQVSESVTPPTPVELHELRDVANEIATTFGKAEIIRDRLKERGLTNVADIEEGDRPEWLAWLNQTLDSLKSGTAS